MKSNDIIRPFEKSLFVQFGSTGELQHVSTLWLDQGRYVYSLGQYDRGAVSRWRRRGAGRRALLERTSRDDGVSEPAGRAVNMAATRAVGGSPAGGIGAAGAASMVPLPSSLGALQQPVARPAVASPAELARAMADGAKSGKYAVQLSKGGKGTLYVFSDPSCPHCQDLEPELDKLAKDYTIYIFPVTVIGGEASSHRTAKLTCAKPEARAALWKKIVQGDELPNAECADGADAVARNDQMFRVMRFLGTPTIINAAGEQTPDSIPNTADAINQWMSAAATASKASKEQHGQVHPVQRRISGSHPKRNRSSGAD